MVSRNPKTGYLWGNEKNLASLCLRLLPITPLITSQSGLKIAGLKLPTMTTEALDALGSIIISFAPLNEFGLPA